MNGATRGLLVLASLLVAAFSRAADETVPALERAGLLFTAGVDSRYDDNILQLSDGDIAQLERNPGSSKFLITSPDDWVVIARLDGRWTHRFFARRETRLHTGADVYRYQTNGVKNWNEYTLELAQELTASRKHLLTLSVGADQVSNFYLRELTDDDASFDAGSRIRRSARYDEIGVSALVDQELIDKRLTAGLGWEHARRDFVPYFDERDGVRTVWRGEIRAQPFPLKRLRCTLAGTTGGYAARGNLPATPIPDDDISYDLHGAELNAVVGWGERRRGHVEGEFAFERRDFTTTNVFDPFHYGRQDRRREYGLRVVQRLSHQVQLSIAWRHLSNDSTAAPGVVLRDDVTNYDQNRFDVGLQVRLGTPSSAKAALRPASANESEIIQASSDPPADRAGGQ